MSSIPMPIPQALLGRPSARPAGRHGITPTGIGRAATCALYDELALGPKPGLVTPHDNGSHHDMDAGTFLRSLFALRGYFVSIAAAGAVDAPFDLLERLGIEAEARMMQATRDVNTHRGAIFMLGLLCAAAGRAAARGVPLDVIAIRTALRHAWGDALERRSQRMPVLPGGQAARQHGLRGASAEAAAGFPVLFEVAWPALYAARRRGLADREARLQTLFEVMAVLDDSNLAHRGGLQGLRDVQSLARGWLGDGGAMAPGAIASAHAIGQVLVERHLSPGGAADTLAAACWLARVTTLPGNAPAGSCPSHRPPPMAPRGTA